MKTIEENNRMIAEFMGATTSDGKYYTIPSLVTTSDSMMKYHTSWDWLMPVVAKIAQTAFNHVELGERIIHVESGFLYAGSMSIHRIYKRVVEFIEWYNENKKP
jgi:hypothetical protein